MTFGSETIPLMPLKNWSQLDTFKWRVRGILPGTPAGLEITFDHAKMGGETVSTLDPDGCAKLQEAFNDWLVLETETLELAKAKALMPKPETMPEPADEDAFRFELETDKAGQARIKCLQGKETVKAVALNPQGFNALIEQGLMRKPGTLKVGALHDWVELDGHLFRFRPESNGLGDLEKALNERYVIGTDSDVPLDVAVFPNPASPSGFDIQFPATPHGLAENRKRHLNEESVELLQDPQKCLVLRKGTIAKFTPPHLIFKQKTPDGGERYLDPSPENVVRARTEAGETKMIDLSQPVNLLDLSALELTAVLNHPAINRRAKLAEAA